MTHLKFPNQVESEIHQILGAEKIQEICDKYWLEDGGKQVLDKILLKLKLNELLRKEKLIHIINHETKGCPEKELVKKVVDTIVELYIFSKQIFLTTP
jgi:hypothetical protein